MKDVVNWCTMAIAPHMKSFGGKMDLFLFTIRIFKNLLLKVQREKHLSACYNETIYIEATQKYNNHQNQLDFRQPLRRPTYLTSQSIH